MWTSTSSASGSTATVTVEVWMRPCDSVEGTRCTRCTPRSCFIRLKTRSPEIDATTSFTPPVALPESDKVSNFHFRVSA